MSTSEAIASTNDPLTRRADATTDEALLPVVAAAVQSAGRLILSRFSPNSRPGSETEVVDAIHDNDAASLGVLRVDLMSARRDVGWAEDELESGALPAGEWWVSDPVEGNINHIHGMTDWGVTATLVRDNLPVLTAVHLPITGDTYTAVQGGGAWLNGTRLRVSEKVDLRAALVGTGQARPGEDAVTHRRIGQSVALMLENALVVRVSVPATLQLVQVAAGRMDAFWQYSQVRSGLFAGALLVAEAGGMVTDTHGRPWTVESGDFLAAAPGIHDTAVDALSDVA